MHAYDLCSLQSPPSVWALPPIMSSRSVMSIHSCREDLLDTCHNNLLHTCRCSLPDTCCARLLHTCSLGASQTLPGGNDKLRDAALHVNHMSIRSRTHDTLLDGS